MKLKRTVLTVAAAVTLAAAGIYPVLLTDWFEQTFAGLVDGADFTGEGAKGGSWRAVPSGAATVATVEGRKCIRIDTASCTNEISFVATNASVAVRRIDFTVSSEPTPWQPPTFDGDRGGLSFAAEDDGVLTFLGYTAEGWVKMSCQGLRESRSEWFDCRAEFGVSTASEPYVAYFVRCGGRDYQPLVDDSGRTQYPVADAQVVGVSFYGAGSAGDFKGMGVEKDLSRVYRWEGPTGENRQWNFPGNWSGEAIPDNGGLAGFPISGKSAVYGKYTITVWAAGNIAITSNECFRILSGDIEIACDDDDYASLGTVIVEAGATLRAGGVYQSIEMAAGSTLIMEAARALQIVGDPFFLDGVNLELDVTDVSGDQVVISAPYGSGGAPASLDAPSQWQVAWHDRLDGSTALWLASRNASGAVAVWNDGAWGNLTAASNWSRKPGLGVAALMGNGRADMSGSVSLLFEYSRWFDIGHAGEGQVSVHRGDFTMDGDAAGAAVIVGSEGGAGTLDLVGGLVRPSDYLWNYALSLSCGTNATGAVTVRGGTVDAAAGSVSVGSDGAASMSVDAGRVLVGDSLGVGFAGTLDVSGGIVAVSNSLYIGRSSRGEPYDVAMTVSDGVVSNLSAGAIWIGSHGGVGSKAVLSLTGGEIYATNRFVCGGYRSAQVDVAGGVLAAPEICLGYDFADEQDVAAFNLVSGRVVTTGFTSGATGERTIALSGGELVATTANDDFFKGIEVVRTEGGAVVSNAHDIVIRSAVAGPGGFVKQGAGTMTIAGRAAWTGETVVQAGALDMDGGLLSGEFSIAPGASVLHAKYDEIDTLLPLLTSEEWTSGTASTRPYVCIDFQMAVDGVTAVAAQDGDGNVKGALRSQVDAASGECAFFGRTALGWKQLAVSDGTTVEAGVAYDLRMIFDLRAVKGGSGKPYVMYYVKCGDAFVRMCDADGVSAFPALGDALSILSFSGVASYVGAQLYAMEGRVFYWIGPDGGNWNDGANWSYEPDGAPAGNYPNAIGDAGSLAYVEKAVRINLPNGGRTSLLVVNDDVCLAGAKALVVSGGISGVGRLTLAGATLQAAGVSVPVQVPVIAEDGTVNALLSTPSSCTFVLNGPLRGAGEIVLTALNRRPMGGTVLAGDNAAFAGCLKIYPYWSSATHQQLDMPSIAAPQASSACAQWEINVEHDYTKVLKPGVDFFGMSDAVYRFGSLKANFYRSDAYNAYWAKDNVTLEVGALDLDSYAVGVCAAKGGAIDWVAPTATFWNGVTGLASLSLRGGGTLVVESEDALPSDAITFADNGGELRYDANTDISGLITNSTAPVVFNGGDGWCEWAGAPGLSNTGGFVKRGSGTLVWYSVPPAHMDVTVEEGVLIVPFGTRLGRISVSSGAAIVVDCANAVTDALVFSADASDIAWISEPELQFRDVPEGYEITRTYGKGNAVVAANGGHEYVWTGLGGDAYWTTLDNWLVGASVPLRPPQALDCVVYGASTYTTRLDWAASAMTLDGAGGLALYGSSTLDALLRFSLNGTLDLLPEPMSADSASAAYYGAATNMLGLSAVTAFSSASIKGEGCVSVGEQDLVVSPADGASDRFVGTLSAARLVKRGGGVFTLVGDGAFSDGVSIEQGTLRIGSYRDLDDMRMDFDASDADAFECDDAAGILRWTSSVGTNVFAYAAGQVARTTEQYFGGRRAVLLRPDAVDGDKTFSRYDLQSANAEDEISRSLFIVHTPIGTDSGYGYAQTGDADRCLYWENGVDNGRWYCPKTGYGAIGVFTGLSYASLPVGSETPAVTFWSGTALQGASEAVESLGTYGKAVGFRGAIGEVLAFSRLLSHIEREVVTRTLMNKWGVSGAGEFSPVHADAPVRMSAGAVLDLGGQTLSVGSFAGAGVVTNGVLLTSDGVITQSGGALSVPAVEGVTYVASHAGEKLIIRDAPGVTLRIVLPKGWFSAGNTGRKAVFCESDRIEWDIWRDDVKPISDGDGWWSISGGGFAVRLR